jgi:ribosome-binding protein aMBF1 (putative translation factor)
MAKSFDDLVARAERNWTADERRVHDAAARVFQLEMTARAELGEQLHAARTAKSLSQPALSAVTGIQQSEISRIESGAANPTVATISKLADALDLKLSLTPQH